MKMRKPDAEIFNVVLENHGLIPEETLFIDDSPQHLATAEKLGLKTRLVAPGEPLSEVLAPYL
ncbi:Alpha-D-glucose-1-phosphate phosphatase YihX [compost metagenome]